MDEALAKPGYKALRKGRHSLPSQVYLVTTACVGRSPRFRDWCCASAASRALTEALLWRDSQLLCWVLMPDHLHLLVELGSSETLSRLMQRVKAVTAQMASVRVAHCGAMWAPGFHDRALRCDEDVVAVARYVIANPLRAGLSHTVGEYPYWNAVWLQDSQSIL